MRYRHKRRLTILGFCCFVFLPFGPASADWQQAGHLKFQLDYLDYDTQALNAPDNTQYALDARMKLERRWDFWDLKLHYQLAGHYYQKLPGIEFYQFNRAQAATDDASKLFDLSKTLAEDNKGELIHRLDRLSLAYNSEFFVARVGRHVVSWGHGLLFNPVDIFNPFDPTTVDKDYKTGDDMLYAQRLFSDGSDLELMLVPRRDLDSGMWKRSKALWR